MIRSHHPLCRPQLAAMALAIASTCLLGIGCAGSAPCGSSDCVCSQDTECPGPLGCWEGLCYGAGSFPFGTACDASDQCEGGHCETAAELGSQGFCSQLCGAGQPAGCPQGWSCYGTNACIADYFLPHGALCTAPRQCPLGDTCLNGVCETLCTTGYDVTACAAGSYCQVDPVPTCIQSRCDPALANGCATPRQCIALAADVGTCREPCTYSVTAAGYNDSCTSDIGFYASTCAPLGVDGVAACVEVGGQRAGQACDGGQSRCQRGTLCAGSRCRVLCSPTTPCATGTCTAIGGDFSVCA